MSCTMSTFEAIRGNWHRLVSWFGQELSGRNQVRVFAIVADNPGQRWGVLISEVSAGSSYRSLTVDVPAADRAERELFEQCGIRPEGHPWLKPVRHPVPAARLEPGRKLGTVPENNIGRDYPFWSLAGDAVHEVGVGPIHAGVIGPGYFRFSCVGEQINTWRSCSASSVEIFKRWSARPIRRVSRYWSNRSRAMHPWPTPSHTPRPWKVCTASKLRRTTKPCGHSHSRTNGWPITWAIWGLWPATSPIGPVLPISAGCVANFSTRPWIWAVTVRVATSFGQAEFAEVSARRRKSG